MDLFVQLNLLRVHNTLQCIEKLHAETYFTTLWVLSDLTVDAKASASCQGKTCMHSKSLSGFVAY